MASHLLPRPDLLGAVREGSGESLLEGQWRAQRVLLEERIVLSMRALPVRRVRKGRVRPVHLEIGGEDAAVVRRHRLGDLVWQEVEAALVGVVRNSLLIDRSEHHADIVDRERRCAHLRRVALTLLGAYHTGRVEIPRAPPWKKRIDYRESRLTNRNESEEQSKEMCMRCMRRRPKSCENSNYMHGKKVGGYVTNEGGGGGSWCDNSRCQILQEHALTNRAPSLRIRRAFEALEMECLPGGPREERRLRRIARLERRARVPRARRLRVRADVRLVRLGDLLHVVAERVAAAPRVARRGRVGALLVERREAIPPRVLDDPPTKIPRLRAEGVAVADETHSMTSGDGAERLPTAEVEVAAHVCHEPIRREAPVLV